MSNKVSEIEITSVLGSEKSVRGKASGKFEGKNVSLVSGVITPLSNTEFLLKINESAIPLNLNSQNNMNYSLIHSLNKLGTYYVCSTIRYFEGIREV